MSPPSIAFPPLPPNLMLTLLFTLTTSAHALPQGSDGRIPPGSSDSTTRHRHSPLSKGEIAGLVCGVLLGVATMVCVALALTNLEWIAEKLDSKKSKKTDSDAESTTTVADAEHKELQFELEKSRHFGSDASSVVTAVPEAHVKN